MIADLPLEHRGYRVPWFAAWYDGKPDLRVVDAEKIPMALTHRLCWICGDALGELGVFIGGESFMMQRLAPEPPSHEDCARHAIKTCPFLALPKARRRVHGMTVNLSQAPKHEIYVLWATREWQRTRTGLVRMGEPVFIERYRGSQRIT